MTIEAKHYIIGFVKVASKEMKEGETVHLRTIHYPEATQLGFPSIGGEAVAESLTVTSPDSVSINYYDPTKGSMEGRPIEEYEGEKINLQHIESRSCCLGTLIGYRVRYHYRP